MTWTDVEKMHPTTGELTYEVSIVPEGTLTERCGYLRCVVTLGGTTAEGVIVDMSVNSIQIADDQESPVDGGQITCIFPCVEHQNVALIFTLTFPDAISEYKAGDAWVFYQEVE